MVASRWLGGGRVESSCGPHWSGRVISLRFGRTCFRFVTAATAGETRPNGLLDSQMRMSGHTLVREWPPARQLTWTHLTTRQICWHFRSQLCPAQPLDPILVTRLVAAKTRHHPIVGLLTHLLGGSGE